MSIGQAVYGDTPAGQTVEVYTLVNNNGLKARLITWGATLTELHVPDKNGTLADVVLGFDDLASYLENPAYFGCTTGRVANRIAKARFTLNGKEYALVANNGPNHLHGGLKGLHKRNWRARLVERDNAAGIEFTYTSPDGEEGYPGNLSMTVAFTLTTENELRIDYTATTDQDTPVNLTNHSYFNLAGAGSGSVLDQQLVVLADHYTPVDDELIPTGEIGSVAGTPLDFTAPTAIGARIAELTGNPGGYDHNLVLNSQDGSLSLAAKLRDPESGRVMEVLTSQPGIQLYSGNFLDGTIIGKGGKAYQKHDALCLETQHYPDSIHQPDWPTVVLQPGQTYRQVTVHRFSTE